jgi:lysophospholipase L1-like esterase
MVALPWEATNSINANKPFVVVLGEVIAWIKQYAAAGARVVLPDVIARGSFTPAQRLVANAFNVYCAQNWQTMGASVFVPVSRVFSDFNSAYYTGDQVHLNDLGYATLAQTLLNPVLQAAAI